MTQNESHSYKMAPPARETRSLSSEWRVREVYSTSFQINRSSECPSDSEEAHITCLGQTKYGVQLNCEIKTFQNFQLSGWYIHLPSQH